MDHFYVVAVFETNKTYGGPEEGGWWYSCGSPYVELGWMTKVFKGTEHTEAHQYRDELQMVCDHINQAEKRHRPSSVLCNGWLEAQVLANEYPSDFPKEAPHYE